MDNLTPPTQDRLFRRPQVFNEFFLFLKDYNIIQLALAFVMGAAANSLVKSLVDNVIMPLLTPFLPGDSWKDAIWSFGPFDLKWGAFTSEFLHFLIIAAVVFVIAKKLFKLEKIK